MPTIFLRANRRVSAWEEDDVSTIVETNFTLQDGSPDLEPSVYLIAGDDFERLWSSAVQVTAEHYARINPPRPANYPIDVRGVGADPHEEPGETGFRFTDNAHRHLSFATEAELKAFVSRVKEDLAGRILPVAPTQLFRYIEARLSDNDPEWAHGGLPEEWKRRLRRLCRTDLPEKERKQLAASEAEAAAEKTEWILAKAPEMGSGNQS